MKHDLPALPYPKDALEPFLSSETLDYHYGKHHKGYIDKLNKLIIGTHFENLPLEQVVLESTNAIFNNAAQAWNHAFFWKCMTPEHHHVPDRILFQVEKSFGSMDSFQGAFIKKGNEVFGSGWLWLVQNNDKLEFVASHDAHNPMKDGKHIILTCDLWEHAYYIDYRNERKRFLEAFVEIINWNFAEGNLKKALETAA